MGIAIPLEPKKSLSLSISDNNEEMSVLESFEIDWMLDLNAISVK